MTPTRFVPADAESAATGLLVDADDATMPCEGVASGAPPVASSTAADATAGDPAPIAVTTTVTTAPGAPTPPSASPAANDESEDTAARFFDVAPAVAPPAVATTFASAAPIAGSAPTAGTPADARPASTAAAVEIVAGATTDNLHLRFAGFNYVADIDGSYASADSIATMISETGSNSVALTDDFGIDAGKSTIYADYNTDTSTGNTATFADMTATIEEAEQDGLSVLVRPLIDFTADASTATLTGSDGNVYYDTEWRAYYNPTSISAFFSSYTTAIVDEAKAAQAGGAQIFDIGTEIDQLTGPSYLSYWTTLINDVRAVFSGALTYSAICYDDLSPWQYGGTNLPVGTGNFATQISFWSQLDYVGIDEYAPISDVDSGGGGSDPTLAELIAGWEDTPTDPTTDAMTGGLSLIKYYENLATTIGKPLLFTEIGYNGAPDAAYQPFYTSSATYDPTLQANLYQAFVDAWAAQGNSSLEGVYIWDWELDPASVGAGSTPSWTPQDNTGALQAVDAAYTAATACFAAGTRIATADGECAVEDLAIGQLVRLTRTDAYAPIVWLGHRRVDCTRHPRPHAVWPVRMRAGAFGHGLPRRDLRLSPDHAIFFDGALIPIRRLLNGTTIVQEPCAAVTYWHVELAHHDVLLAEGLPSESFLDTGNRPAFANGGPAVHLHPGFTARHWDADACAPLVLSGLALERARTRLRAIAAQERRSARHG